MLPANLEAYSNESRRHFNECFSLAWAQQLKNKDIPEGGSKAVCLVTPTAGLERDQLMHGCVKVRLRVGLGLGLGLALTLARTLALTRPSPTACST